MCVTVKLSDNATYAKCFTDPTVNYLGIEVGDALGVC
jgi:hypothetical protein